MNRKWLNLAGELLQTASDEFANHRCNDWDWPEDWSLVDRQEFATKLMEDNSHKQESDFTDEEREELESLISNNPPNWWVMDFLGNQLHKI